MIFRSLLAVVFLCATLLATSARAEETRERNTASTYGLGLGAVLCSLVYGPVKVVYATLGTVIGGTAWVLTGGRSDVAREIIEPSVRGDYIVTPKNLTMEEPLVFTGRERSLDEPAQDASNEWQ
jgi:hypothetical protein